MALMTSCEKHALKELQNFFKNYIAFKKTRNGHTLKEYKTRCQKMKLIRNFIKDSIQQLYFGTLV